MSASDALASIFGTGPMQDLTPVTWDDRALTVTRNLSALRHGVDPRSGRHCA